MARGRHYDPDDDYDEMEQDGPDPSRTRAMQQIALVVVVVVGVAGVGGAFWWRAKKQTERAERTYQQTLKSLRKLGIDRVEDLYEEAEAMIHAGEARIDTRALSGYLDDKRIIDAVVVRRKSKKDIYVGSAGGSGPAYGTGSDVKRKNFKGGVWMVTDAAYQIQGKAERVWLFCKDVHSDKNPDEVIGRAMIFLEPPQDLRKKK